MLSNKIPDQHFGFGFGRNISVFKEMFFSESFFGRKFIKILSLK